MTAAGETPIHDFPDRAIRRLFRHAEPLRGLLSRAAPELAPGLDCEHARPLEREFLLEDWRNRESDLLFLIPYKAGAGDALVCVLIEHQSEADPRMPLRTLLYAVLYWERQWKEWEERPPPRPAFRLTPVLPVVFHTAGRPWGSNRKLTELLAEPKEFHPFAPQWEPIFWDLASLAPEALLNSGEAWLQALAVVRAEGEDAAAFRRIFTNALQRLEALRDRDKIAWSDLAEMVLTWGLWRRPAAEREPLKDAARASQKEATHQKEVGEMAQTIAESYIEEGMREGELRAYRKALRTQLEERFQSIPEALVQRIDAMTDAQRLLTCIRQVVHLHSLDDLKLD